MDILFYYLLLINAVGALLMIVDKSRARKKMHRISEINLFSVAIVGGAIGELFGMYMVRHKTKHRRFTIGLPILIAIQVLAFVAVIVL